VLVLVIVLDGKTANYEHEHRFAAHEHAAAASTPRHLTGPGATSKSDTTIPSAAAKFGALGTSGN
jgi:hypothetical protein